MAKFLTSNSLNGAVESILEEAEVQLILISPYIKLHERYISVLKAKIENPSLAITIVFGKNEDDPSKSLKLDDLKFFMQFPNVVLKYEKKLHAKYYANEHSALITSMNLYNFSQDYNIEAGILVKTSILGAFTGGDSLDADAFACFERVIAQAETIYKKVPIFDSSLMGLKKTYKESRVEVDKVDDFFKTSAKGQERPAYTKPKQEYSAPISATKVKTGYCIRTGQEIPFNPQRPFSEAAYNSWIKFKNEEYPEKYCHFSGESSSGETSFARPIMRKNWQKAKSEHMM